MQPAAAIVAVVAAGVYTINWGYICHKEKTQVFEPASRISELRVPMHLHPRSGCHCGGVVQRGARVRKVVHARFAQQGT